MKQIKIYFVRHGETDQNKLRRIQGRRNFPLNEMGKSQAKQAGLYLLKNNIHFDKIYSSPLDRAYLTACIIADTINYKDEIIKREYFTERDFGEAEGLSVSEDNFQGVINETYIGLEKSQELSNRVKNGVLDIIKENPDCESFLIVAHSHTIKGFLKYLDPTYPYYSSMCNCAINYFTYYNDEFKLVSKNINPLNQ